MITELKTSFKRREIKYFITAQQQQELLEFMSHRISEDKWGKSIIQSLYFDTPSNLLIRTSLEHPLYKEKFRMRCYGLMTNNSKIFAEIKKKYKSIVYKRRIVLNKAQADDFYINGPPNGSSVTEKEISFFFKKYDNLKSRVLIQCEREAYFDKVDCGLRFTFDHNIL